MMSKAGCALVVALLLCAAVFPIRAQEAGETERVAVLAAVQHFLDAMAQRDTAEARKVVMPEGRVFSVRIEADEPVIRTFTFQEDMDKWAMRSGSILERVWNSEVRVHGRIATVWTAYDFYKSGRFSHCGIDVFDLVKTANGWKLTGGVYTVETESCPESPLGPPRPETTSEPEDPVEPERRR
ncbi:MAG: hypothetical protein GTO42_01285 [Candidatus Latescibacteria bacterium]|nr:hypothetical protein [Candidatus Latescibacterota bacterium]NIO27162.1 hypothetical protein [Candidatus Latescibacterota bacterium]NIO54686.1 hypothetical protein [Candidatus Latescibacterota bacterium]NIT00769.1 hypothetical protein [Candidatus Latescibacterota bacterium]NIT37692.1 hypothetical protein [Candidatus Latescibacterota bacterium]